jgi:hypothetical protein
VTRAAEQSIVLEATLAAAVGDRDDVVRFPAWAGPAPRAPCGAILGWRLRSRPLPVSLHDIDAAHLTDSLVTLLDLLTDVPRAAADLPLVDARVAAKRASRRTNGPAAPATDRLSGGVALWLAPLVRCDDTRAASAHARDYRNKSDRPLAGTSFVPHFVPRVSDPATNCRRAVANLHASKFV